MARSSTARLALTSLLLTEQLAATLLQVTQYSSHSYEVAMHRLLLDLEEDRMHGDLTLTEYHAILGTAVDVLFYFNYSLEMLAGETDPWYRASVIHQMAYAMLQAGALMRPSLAAKPFFNEAWQALRFDRAHLQPTGDATQPAPITCHRWASYA